MVRLQIYSPNLKIYLKHCTAWPCQKVEVSGLWMMVQSELEPDSGWGLCARPCTGKRYAWSSLAVSLLVEQHQLLVFLHTVPYAHAREDVWLPDAQIAIFHLLCKPVASSLEMFPNPDSTWGHLLDRAVLVLSSFLCLHSFSIYTLWLFKGVRTPCRIPCETGRLKKKIEGELICVSL